MEKKRKRRRRRIRRSHRLLRMVLRSLRLLGKNPRRNPFSTRHPLHLEGTLTLVLVHFQTGHLRKMVTVGVSVTLPL